MNAFPHAPANTRLGRAIEAPQIRKIFSCSPRDPRYHMLEHLSPKFRMPPTEREPRAALILNRFTRTLTVMFATNAVSSILGVSPEQLQGKSFYECIAENCLADAIKCLESAKANDSIAYLRFWSRDPRSEEEFEDDEVDMEMEDEDEDEVEEDSDGASHFDDITDIQMDNAPSDFIKTEATSSLDMGHALPLYGQSSRGGSSPTIATQARTATARVSERQVAERVAQAGRRGPIPSCELEGVVSCTSDGLVMVLRKARPPIPSLHPPLIPSIFENGLFAAPWSEHPIRPNYQPELFHTFQPPLQPQYMPLREPTKAAGGPPTEQLMKSIREVAVFAWPVVGINGTLASYSRGQPRGESQPFNGLPVWDPDAAGTTYLGPELPSSSRLGRRSIDNHSAEHGSLAHLYTPNPIAGRGQGHAHLPSQLSNMSACRLSTPFWSNSSTIAPSSEGRLFSEVQQPLQYVINGHPNSSLQPQLEGEVWTEASTSNSQQNVNNNQFPTTQSYSFGDSPQNTWHAWN